MTENGSTQVELSELDQKIIRQVEYYFGDSNLARDKFMQEKIKEDDGWISMDVMLNFKRLSALSEDKGVILAALKKSESGLIEVGEDKIRRSPEKPLPENYDEIKDKSKDRCVYAKGFPKDATLDDIMEFMNKFGPTEYINMRRIPKDKSFKGSIFCTYINDDDAKKFLAEEAVKYGEIELVRFTKDDYFKHKQEERKQAKEASLKAKQEKADAESASALKDRFTKGAILHIKNLPEDTKRTELKEHLNQIEPVHWVDYDDGDTEAKVRFTTENGAVQGLEKAKESGEDGKFMYGGNEIVGRVLEGEEEEEHWQELVKHWRGNRDRKRGGRGGRGGGRGGYSNRGQKRSAGGNSGVPAKQAKTE